MPRIALNDVSLYYESTGHGQPLVFIHGLGSSTRDWEAQVPKFAKACQVITFDQRGHGQSDKPAGPYTISMFAADTANLLRALGVQSAHIVGLSLGGGVAFQLALDEPQLVKTLVIVNSGPVGMNTPELRQEIDRRVGIVQQMGMRAMGEALSKNLFPKEEHAAERLTFVERWAENDPRAYIDALRSLQDWSVMDKLGAIECPTLVISADQDYTPVAFKELYVKRMPNAELAVIADARHATPMERPQEFNAVLARFLAQHP